MDCGTTWLLLLYGFPAAQAAFSARRHGSAFDAAWNNAPLRGVGIRDQTRSGPIPSASDSPDRLQLPVSSRKTSPTLPRGMLLAIIKGLRASAGCLTGDAARRVWSCAAGARAVFWRPTLKSRLLK